jgi:hypothetical protein
LKEFLPALAQGFLKRLALAFLKQSALTYLPCFRAMAKLTATATGLATACASARVSEF